MKPYQITIPLLVGSALTTSLFLALNSVAKGEFLLFCVLSVISEWIIRTILEFKDNKWPTPKPINIESYE